MEPEYQPIARLQCGSESGTAFLIAPNKALTARHTIDEYLEDGEKIELFFPNIEQGQILREAKVLFPKKPYVGEDAAILELNKPVKHVNPLVLSSLRVSQGEVWKSFGFPSSKRKPGEVFSGYINQAYITNRDEGEYDIDLACEHPKIFDPSYKTKGASGSPIFKANKVIAILSDKSPGGSIGGVSIVSFQEAIERENILLDDCSYFKKVSYSTNDGSIATSSPLSNLSPEDTIVKIKSTPFEEKIEEVKSTVINLIEDFPKDSHLTLQQSLNQMIQHISNNNSSIIENYLHKYRFPFTLDHNIEVGLEQLLEILTLIKSTFPGVEICGDDLTANICIDEQADLFALVIYAVRRHTKMPQIILEINRKIQNTPTGKKMVRRGEQLLPYPLILDNCSGHKKVNMCTNCQSEFSFENLLKDFCVAEEEGYFKGITQNNFGLLSESKVICANCLRSISNEVINFDELTERIREMIT